MAHTPLHLCLLLDQRAAAAHCDSCEVRAASRPHIVGAQRRWRLLRTRSSHQGCGGVRRRALTLQKSYTVPIPPLFTAMERGAPAVAHLPDELIVEILARLPARSLCRFKCVSRSWRGLICDPAHRAKLAQTLSGFFVSPRARALGRRAVGRLPCHFVDLSPRGGNDGPPLVDTALSFLPPTFGQMELVDSCNGLLLLLCWGAPPPDVHPFYVVCNPATREWLALPQPKEAPGQNGDPMGEDKLTCSVALGFDPAISSNFHVFQLLETAYQTEYEVAAVEIYSSETGRWIFSERGWGAGECHLFDDSMTYLNSVLHFTVQRGAIVAVDTRGEAWRVNCVRPQFRESYGNGFTGHSQGRLLYMFDDDRGDFLSVYVLEGRGSEEWTFKHNISKADLFGPRKWDYGPYYQVAFHPDADLIFVYDWQRQHNRLISYGMTNMDVHAINTIGGEGCSICTALGMECSDHHLLPYSPLYSRTLVSPIVN